MCAIVMVNAPRACGHPNTARMLTNSSSSESPVITSGMTSGAATIPFARIIVTVGKPISLTPEELKSAKGKDDYDRIAKRIMTAIREL